MTKAIQFLFFYTLAGFALASTKSGVRFYGFGSTHSDHNEALEEIAKINSTDLHTAQKAYTLLLKEYGNYIQSIVFRRSRMVGLDPDEITSQVHLKIWTSRYRLRVRSSRELLVWLRTVVINCIIDTKRTFEVHRLTSASLSNIDHDLHHFRSPSYYRRHDNFQDPSNTSIEPTFPNKDDPNLLEFDQASLRSELVESTLYRLVSMIQASETQVKVAYELIDGRTIREITDNLKLPFGTTKSARKLIIDKLRSIPGIDQIFQNALVNQTTFVHEIELEILSLLEAVDMQTIDTHLIDFDHFKGRAKSSSFTLPLLVDLIEKSDIPANERDVLLTLTRFGWNSEQIAREFKNDTETVNPLIQQGIDRLNKSRPEDPALSRKDLDFVDFTKPRFKPNITPANKAAHREILLQLSNRKRLVWRMLFQKGFSTFQTSVLLNETLDDVEKFMISHDHEFSEH